MKTLSPALIAAFDQSLKSSAVPIGMQMDYRKWLRFYLDFCMKYRHPPRDPDSLEPFLQKLASKNQSKASQEQAAASVTLYYDIIRNWPDSGSLSPVISKPADTAPKQVAVSKEIAKPFARNRLGTASPPKGEDDGGVRGTGGTPTLPGSLHTDAPASMVREGTSKHDDQQASNLTWADCYRRLKEEIRVRQYSPKTLSTYRIWTEQFQRFLKDKPPADLTSEDAVHYLTHLATDCKVVASTQNQAFNSLLFLYRHILKADYDLKDKVVRARRTRYIPVVLTREEVDRVIEFLEYPFNLVTGVLYGCGLRLFEGLNLRVGCINFDDQILTVHDGKGKKDRTVPLPETLIPQLKQHIKRVYALHAKDMEEGYDGVFMPGALDRKWKNASKELVWQWVFPAKTLTFVPDKNEHRRYHLHESVFQKTLREAVRKAQIPKRVTAHTFRHSFASHLLLHNYDIRTIQEMLGHSDVRTTMIYTHTVKSRTQKERKSPLDFEPGQGRTVQDRQ
jgi:integron integrase